MLLSAGVPVEVCRVKAKEDDGRPVMRTKRTDSGKSKRVAAKPEPIVVDDSDDEWQYESGEEGKPEGRWARPGEAKRRK